MIALVNRFKSKQMSIQEFLAISKNLLGDRLYAVLVLMRSIKDVLLITVRRRE